MHNHTMVTVFGHDENLEKSELEITLLSDKTAIFVIYELDDDKERVNELKSLQYEIDLYFAKQIISLLQNHFNL